MYKDTGEYTIAGRKIVDYVCSICEKPIGRTAFGQVDFFYDENSKIEVQAFIKTCKQRRLKTGEVIEDIDDKRADICYDCMTTKVIPCIEEKFGKIFYSRRELDYGGV